MLAALGLRAARRGRRAARPGRGQGEHAGRHRAEHHRAPGDAGRPAAGAVEGGPDQRPGRPPAGPRSRRTGRCRRRAGRAAGRGRRRGRGPCRRRSTWGRGGRPAPRSGSRRRAPARASTVGGTSSSRSGAAEAVATRWSPSRSRTVGMPAPEVSAVAVASRTIDSGRSSGGGEARRTLTAGQSVVVGTCSARAPLTQPPLPDSGGPQKRRGMVELHVAQPTHGGRAEVILTSRYVASEVRGRNLQPRCGTVPAPEVKVPGSGEKVGTREVGWA